MKCRATSKPTMISSAMTPPMIQRWGLLPNDPGKLADSAGVAGVVGCEMRSRPMYVTEDESDWGCSGCAATMKILGRGRPVRALRKCRPRGAFSTREHAGETGGCG